MTCPTHGFTTQNFYTKRALPAQCVVCLIIIVTVVPICYEVIYVSVVNTSSIVHTISLQL